MSESILIVEDDLNIFQLIAPNISSLGYAVEHADDGKVGLEKALENDYALLILDLQLPSLDGMEICRRVRDHSPSVPILMLTSRSDELDKVMGLESGADDYLTKPFSPRELTARVRALIRRSSLPQQQANEETDVIKFKDLTIDLLKQRVMLKGEPVTITPLEFKFLAFIASHPGRPFTRQQLIEQVWGYEASGYEETVSALVMRLRKKLEADPSNPAYITTVRGMGYAFCDTTEPQVSDANE